MARKQTMETVNEVSANVTRTSPTHFPPLSASGIPISGRWKREVLTTICAKDLLNRPNVFSAQDPIAAVVIIPTLSHSTVQHIRALMAKYPMTTISNFTRPIPM